ncbi:MAG: NYN domain-containing protein [bacterium]
MNILIIDGYNIINQWADLKKELKRSGLEYTRNKLIEILAEYQTFTGDRVIVVFDGYKTDKRLITKSSQFGVEVIFSKRKQTADSLIERLVYNERGEDKTIFVASRDTALERMIFGMDCFTISPQKLEERINAVKLEIKGYF